MDQLLHRPKYFIRKAIYFGYIIIFINLTEWAAIAIKLSFWQDKLLLCSHIFLDRLYWCHCIQVFRSKLINNTIQQIIPSSLILNNETKQYYVRFSLTWHSLKLYKLLCFVHYVIKKVPYQSIIIQIYR